MTIRVVLVRVLGLPRVLTRGKVINRRGTNPCKKLMLRQEDMSQQVVGSSPVLGFFFKKSLLKYSCAMNLLWNLYTKHVRDV